MVKNSDEDSNQNSIRCLSFHQVFFLTFPFRIPNGKANNIKTPHQKFWSEKHYFCFVLTWLCSKVPICVLMDSLFFPFLCLLLICSNGILFPFSSVSFPSGEAAEWFRLIQQALQPRLDWQKFSIVVLNLSPTET